ncbi:MAG TPA: hypothetical protein VFR88_06860 [Microlunatus sp.]|nr:hypothetical protein [Microlunatus sp.]
MRRRVALGCVGLMLVGCSYSAEEPGLLRPTPATRGGSPVTRVAPPPTPPVTNPELPVLAEAVWTSADGLGVRVRIGVHAVRRVDGATVLDWSVTPLTAPNLQPGDPVPTTLDLGLSDPADERPLIALLDVRSDRLYRPLTHATDPVRCVCTPLSLALDRFRIGHTTLLQVAFPPLPGSSSTVDVVPATVAPFGQVPVTPAGRVPVAVRPAELARPADTASVAVGTSEMFRYGPGEQVFRLRVHRVLAGRGFTTVEWTIWSVTGGAGLDAATDPPFAERAADGTGEAARPRASGPVLSPATRAGTQTLRPRLVVTDAAGGGPPECLCSPLDGWTSVLRRPDKPAAVVTTYPPLPDGVGRVRVRFAGLADLSMPVTPAPDARARAAGVRPWTTATWRSGDLRSGPGWSSASWPTPVPAAEELPATAPGPYPLVR